MSKVKFFLLCMIFVFGFYISEKVSEDVLSLLLGVAITLLIIAPIVILIAYFYNKNMQNLIEENKSYRDKILTDKANSRYNNGGTPHIIVMSPGGYLQDQQQKQITVKKEVEESNEERERRLLLEARLKRVFEINDNSGDDDETVNGEFRIIGDEGGNW